MFGWWVETGCGNGKTIDRSTAPKQGVKTRAGSINQRECSRTQRDKFAQRKASRRFLKEMKRHYITVKGAMRPGEKRRTKCAKQTVELWILRILFSKIAFATIEILI
jgi:hypothetical protein